MSEEDVAHQATAHAGHARGGAADMRQDRCCHCRHHCCGPRAPAAAGNLAPGRAGQAQRAAAAVVWWWVCGVVFAAGSGRRGGHCRLRPCARRTDAVSLHRSSSGCGSSSSPPTGPLSVFRTLSKAQPCGCTKGSPLSAALASSAAPREPRHSTRAGCIVHAAPAARAAPARSRHKPRPAASGRPATTNLEGGRKMPPPSPSADSGLQAGPPPRHSLLLRNASEPRRRHPPRD